MTTMIARHTGWQKEYIEWQLPLRDAWGIMRELCEADGIKTISPGELDHMAAQVF